MEGFPSGQREQTVNLSSMTSVVRIHHLPPKEPILIRVSVLFWCQVEWIRKPALRNVPVTRFNRRGFAAAKRIHHRTGRHACSSATIGGNSQSRQARAQSEGQTSAPVSSLDKTQAYVIMNTRDAVTAVRPLTDQQLKVIDRSGA